jgi:hypothetical protein
MSRWQDREPDPYPPPAPGEKARMLPDPVGPPDAPPERPLRERLHPGDPACPACREHADRCCGEHRDYYHAYDPVASLPGGGPAAREDQVRWGDDPRRATVEDLSRAGMTWR